MSGTYTQPKRLAYLSALGIDVWHERGKPVAESPVSAGSDAPVDAASAGETGNDGWRDEWRALQASVEGCTRCALHKTRTQTVFGVGSATADWMIIGEAPGAEEDRRGEPFVGRAGKLLDEMLRAVGLDRQTVFIANILKCRPPNNRDPAADESAECRAYLDQQIRMVQPKIILAVGRIAAQLLLNCDTPVGRLRGQLHAVGDTEIPTVVTYHPAYLLRSPTQKRKVWQDLCMAKATMERSPA
jgi:DNA polymerase